MKEGREEGEEGGTDRNDGKARGKRRKGTNRYREGQGEKRREGGRQTRPQEPFCPLTWKGRVQVICLMTQVTYKAPAWLTFGTWKY